MKFHLGDCPRIYISHEETTQLALDFARAAREYRDCLRESNKSVTLFDMLELGRVKDVAEKRLIEIVERVAV